MLLIFAIVLLLKRYGTYAIPLPDPLPGPSSPSSAFDTPIFTRDDSSTSDGGQRTVLDILWSCLATTFACTWISVHPNVPWKGEGKWTILGRRIYLMFFSILAPEFMVMWAYKQWRGARMIKEVVNDTMRKAYSESGEKQPRLWTVAHGHLLQMGGFKLYATITENYYWGGFKVLGDRRRKPRDMDGEEPSDASSFLKRSKHTFGQTLEHMPIYKEYLFESGEVNSVIDTNGSLPNASSSTKGNILEGVLRINSLKQLLVEGLVDLPDITEDEINDRSKGGALSKGISLLQLTWFVVQIITRAARGLAISELELTTAALAGLNIIMYMFWWGKPRDVRFPVVVRTKRVEKLLAERLVNDVEWRFSADNFDLRKHLWASITETTTAVCISLTCIYLKLFKWIKAIPQHIQIFRVLSAIRKFPKYAPVAVPVGDSGTFAQDPDVQEAGHESPRRSSHSKLQQFSHKLKSVAMLAMKCAVFPVKFLFLVLRIPISSILYNESWELSFDMIFYSEHAHDRPLLNTSCIAGALFGAVHCLAWHFSFPTRAEEIMWRAASLGVVGLCALASTSICMSVIWNSLDLPNLNTGIGSAILFLFSILLSVVYPIARFTLLVLAVISLRSLPPSAFHTVDWVELIPHI